MLEFVISSTTLTAVVIALRRLLRGRINPLFQYALWGIVLLRLLLPAGIITSAISVVNFIPKAVITQTEAAVENTQIRVKPVQEFTSDEYKKAYAADHNIPASQIQPPTPSQIAQYAESRASVTLGQIIKIVWFCGIGVAAGLLLFTNLNFYIKLRRTRTPFQTDLTRRKVYLAENLPSPCLYGIIRPAIYITSASLESETVLRHVITHELTHYRHLDHIWSLMRGVCLALHWYNPLVWLAAVLSKGDSELACDEGAIKRLGEESRFEYGKSLIQLTTSRPSPTRILYCATTMASDKRAISRRIKNIAKKPKTLAAAAIAVIVILAAAVGCTFSKPVEESAETPTASAAPANVTPDSSPPQASGGEAYAGPLATYSNLDTYVSIPESYSSDVFSASDLAEDIPNTAIVTYYATKVADNTEYGGFLFSVLKYTTAQHEQFFTQDGSGYSFFATDGEFYYGFYQPTDVQAPPEYYDDYAALSLELRNFIVDDFQSRAGMKKVDDTAFFQQEYTYDSPHETIAYSRYMTVNGSRDPIYFLILSQPVKQGVGGIWCVERWTDVNGNVYPLFPDTGVPSAEYYAQLQADCDDGKNAQWLDPKQMALEFVKTSPYFQDYNATLESFDFNITSTADLFDRSTGNIYDYMEDLISPATSVPDYLLFPCFENFTRQTWLDLQQTYQGQDWTKYLFMSIRNGAIGTDQANRDYYMLKLMLTADGAYAETVIPAALRQFQSNPQTFTEVLYNKSNNISSAFTGAEQNTISNAISLSTLYDGNTDFVMYTPNGTFLSLAYYTVFPVDLNLKSDQPTKRANDVMYGETGDGISVQYLAPYEDAPYFYVNGIATTREGYSVMGVSVGTSEPSMTSAFAYNYPDKSLQKSEALTSTGNGLFSNYDYAYKYVEYGSKNAVYYFITNEIVTGIAINAAVS